VFGFCLCGQHVFDKAGRLIFRGCITMARGHRRAHGAFFFNNQTIEEKVGRHEKGEAKIRLKGQAEFWLHP
jgi:hypothetical protein